MPVLRPLAIALLAAALTPFALAAPLRAADVPPHRGACLSKTEQRAAVAAHRAVPLAQAIKKLHARGHHAEVVRARLCRHNGRLVYVLTLLARSGKVTRASIDATDGELITGR